MSALRVYQARHAPSVLFFSPPAETSMASASRPSRLLREPLLHFSLLGALLFGVDHLIASRQGDPHLIVITADIDKDARKLFVDAKGREPTAADMAILRTRWFDNEVLYREGLALRVDQGDSTIRERVIFKTLNMVQANLQAPQISDADLRAWFDTQRANYGEPGRIDFLEAVRVGERSAPAIAAFVATLNGGAGGDAGGGLRVYTGRPRSSLVSSFGADFTAALETSSVGVWQALAGRDGVHIVRLEAVHAPTRVEFDAVRIEVLQDWKDAQLLTQRTDAVHAVGKKYRLQIAEAAK